MAFVAINPSNGQEIRRHPYLSPEALEAGLAALNSQQSQWALESMASRAERLLKLAAQLESCAPALAQLMAEELGHQAVKATAPKRAGRLGQDPRLIDLYFSDLERPAIILDKVSWLEKNRTNIV